MICERFSSEILNRRCRIHLECLKNPTYMCVPECERKGAAEEGLIKSGKEKKH